MTLLSRTSVGLLRDLFGEAKKGDDRSAAQLRQHYEVEKELANRLRNAPRAERAFLYSSLYDELYRRVPDHPQLTRKTFPETRAAAINAQMSLLRRFVNKDSSFLELGPGDCALSCAVAKWVRHVYAIDVSEEITRNTNRPTNFKLVLSDGSSVPLPPGTIDVAYSNQLMEHLHPEDAVEQLRNIYEVLAPGGIYVCCTPNRLGGPWDISMHFDPVASGFHMREYTYAELYRLFRDAGFRRIRGILAVRGRYLQIPIQVMCVIERILGMLPYKKISGYLPFRLLLEELKLAGMK
jgi:SAM-dependent methyltransferase